MGKAKEAAFAAWVKKFPEATDRNHVMLRHGFLAGWSAALNVVEAMLCVPDRLTTADCMEDRHDQCGQKGSTNPMKVCGCPCHGQYTRKARR